MNSGYRTSRIKNIGLIQAATANLTRQTAGGVKMREPYSIETERKAAWRCLNDASTLPGAYVENPGVSIDGSPSAQPGGLARWQARKTLAYIEANLASKMELGELANGVALSKSHFSRAFKRCLGFSPMEYVIARRVERAKLMIRSTRQPLAEVALACGFADQSHLNRRFRELMGVSPGRWRRSHEAVAIL